MFLSGEERLSPVKEVDLSKFFVLVPWGFLFVPFVPRDGYINRHIRWPISEIEKLTEPPEPKFYFYLSFRPKGSTRELAEEIWESIWLSCPEIIPLGKEARKPLLEALNSYLEDLFAKKVWVAYLSTYNSGGEQEEELVRLYKKHNLGDLLRIDRKNARIVPEEGYEKEATVALTKFSAGAILWALEEEEKGKKGNEMTTKRAKVGFEVEDAKGVGSLKVGRVPLTPFGEEIKDITYEISVTSPKAKEMVESWQGRKMIINAAKLIVPRVKEWLRIIAERAEDFAPSLSFSNKYDEKHKIELRFENPEGFQAAFLNLPYYPITITEQAWYRAHRGLQVRLSRKAKVLLVQKGVKYEVEEESGTREGRIAEWTKKIWGVSLGSRDYDEYKYDRIAVAPRRRDHIEAAALVFQIESAMEADIKDSALGELLMVYVLHSINKIKEEINKARNLGQKLCIMGKTFMPLEEIFTKLPKGLNPLDEQEGLLQLARKAFLSPPYPEASYPYPEASYENVNDFPETYILAFLGLRNFIEVQKGNGARVSMEPVYELERKAGLPGRISVFLEGKERSDLEKDLARLLIITYNLTRYAIRQHPTSEYREPMGMNLRVGMRSIDKSLRSREVEVLYSYLAKVGEGTDMEEMNLDERIELRVE